MNEELTQRQLDLLKAINELTVKNGIPSLRELRKRLGLKTNQFAVDLLRQLEEKKIISREKGKSRSLVITNEGKKILGISPRVFIDTARPILRLEEHQKKISERLLIVDSKLRDVYFGGLQVLLDVENPDRIRQSAHSMREIISWLSNKADDWMNDEEKKKIKNWVEDKKSDKKVRAIKLAKSRDPNSPLKDDKENIYYFFDNEFYQYFSKIAHWRSNREINSEELFEKIRDFEEFLIKYILPLQVELYASIDEILEKGSGSVDLESLKKLLDTTRETKRHFYNKADNTWLEFLLNNQLLSPLTLENIEYLVRIAAKEPKIISEFLWESEVNNLHYWLIRNFIEAAKNMPCEYVSGLLTKIKDEKWLEQSANHWLAFPLIELFEKLLNTKAYELCLQLSRLLLQIKTPNDREGGRSHLDTQGVIEKYEYNKLLEKFKDIPSEKLKEFVVLLVETLNNVWVGDKDRDYSIGWRSAIESSEQNWHFGDIPNALVSCLRDCLEKYLNHVKSIGGDVSAEFKKIIPSKYKYSIFDRLRIHVYRLHQDAFKQAIQQTILKFFDDTDVWHEYMLLLKESFGKFPDNIKQNYLNLINNGPKLKDNDPVYVKRWKLKKYAIIEKHLSGKDKSEYKKLASELQKPSDEDLLYLMTHKSWSGPTASITEEDFDRMELSKIIDYFIKWEPKDDWCSPSREGLGREFQKTVSKKAKYFSDNASLFLNKAIRPVYIYHLFLGLNEGLKQGAQINWKEIIKLFKTLLHKDKSGELISIEGDKDDMKIGWDPAFKWGLDLIENALNSKEDPIDFRHRKDIWEIINYLSQYTRLEKEEEIKEFLEKERDLYHESINTLQGQAFHALYAYIFWADRNTKDKTNRITEEAKEVINKSLDDGHLNLIIRSVHGFYYPWMYVYDSQWAKTLITKLFPLEEFDLRYSAWITLLYRNLFQEVFAALRERYEEAINELKKNELKKGKYKDSAERLAQHVILAFVHGFDNKKPSLYEKFFNTANGAQRGEAISFAGRAYISSDNTTRKIEVEHLEKLKELWEWRLKETNGKENDAIKDELINFGWWAKKDKFENKWMLNQLLETVKKTGGLIEGEFIVFQTINELAFEYPELVMKILNLIVFSKAKERTFLFSRNELKNILTKVFSGSSIEAKTIGKRIVDYLTRLGLKEYSDILSSDIDVEDQK